MADFLQRYAGNIDPNDESIPQSIRDKLTGANIPGVHVGDALDARIGDRSWGQKTASGVTQELLGQRHLALGLGNYLLGDQDAAVARLKRWEENNQRVNEIAPEFKDFEQIKDFQSGASVLGYQLAKLAPDAILGLGIGAIGKKGATAAAEAAAVEAAARVLATSAAKKEALVIAEKQGLDALKETAGYKAADAAKRTAMEQGRLQQVRETAKDGLLAEARKKLSPEAVKAIGKRGDLGFAIGATVGSIPSNLQDQGQFMLERPDLTREEALKLLAGTTASASTDFIPLAGWLNRFSKKGVEAARKADELFTPRFVKAVVKQAGAEGGQEAVQAMITRQSQNWVDENINMFDQEAMQEYFMNFVAGGLLGGTMGGAGEIGSTTSNAIGNLFKASFKKMEAARLDRENARAQAERDPNTINVPPGGFSSADPTSGTQAAAAAAQASGRTLNPQAAAVLNGDAPQSGDLGSQIKFSQRIDEQSTDLLTEWQNRVAAYRTGGVNAAAQGYDAGVTDVLFPVGIRLGEESLPFANIAAGFGFTNTNKTSEQLKADPLYIYGMRALEKIMRFGMDSTAVTKEDKEYYADLVSMSAEPWRFSVVTALRDLNPTLHAETLAGIDDRLAALKQQTQKEDFNLAESMGVSRDEIANVTGQLDPEGTEGGPEGAGANPDAMALTTNQRTSMLDRDVTSENRANALAYLLNGRKRAFDDGTEDKSRPLGAGEILTREEFEPALVEALKDPAVIAQLGGRDAAIGAYERLQQMLEEKARLMQGSYRREDGTPTNTQERVKQLNKRFEAQVIQNKTLDALANIIRARVMAAADAKTRAEVSANSGVFPNYNQVAFDERKNNETENSAYAVSDERNLIDLGSQMARFISSADGKEERAGKKSGANAIQQQLALLAQLSTNPQLPIDLDTVPWGKKFTIKRFGDREFVFNKKPDNFDTFVEPARKKGENDLAYAKRTKFLRDKHEANQRKMVAESLAAFVAKYGKTAAESKTVQKQVQERETKKAELAKKGAALKEKRANTPPEKRVYETPTSLAVDEIGSGGGADAERVSLGDFVSTDANGNILVEELQPYNASGLKDEEVVPEGRSPSQEARKLIRAINRDKDAAFILNILDKLGIPDATQLKWDAAENGWRVFVGKELQKGILSVAEVEAKAPEMLTNPMMNIFGFEAGNPKKQNVTIGRKERPKTSADLAAFVKDLLIKKIDGNASARSISQQTQRIMDMRGPALRKALDDVLAGDYDTGAYRATEETSQEYKKPENVRDEFGDEVVSDAANQEKIDALENKESFVADDLRNLALAYARKKGVEDKYVLWVFKQANAIANNPNFKTSDQRLNALGNAINVMIEKRGEFGDGLRSMMRDMNVDFNLQKPKPETKLRDNEKADTDVPAGKAKLVPTYMSPETKEKLDKEAAKEADFDATLTEFAQLMRVWMSKKKPLTDKQRVRAAFTKVKQDTTQNVGITKEEAAKDTTVLPKKDPLRPQTDMRGWIESAVQAFIQRQVDVGLKTAEKADKVSRPVAAALDTPFAWAYKLKKAEEKAKSARAQFDTDELVQDLKALNTPQAIEFVKRLEAASKLFVTPAAENKFNKELTSEIDALRAVAPANDPANVEKYFDAVERAYDAAFAKRSERVSKLLASPLAKTVQAQRNNPALKKPKLPENITPSKQVNKPDPRAAARARLSKFTAAEQARLKAAWDKLPDQWKEKILDGTLKLPKSLATQIQQAWQKRAVSKVDPTQKATSATDGQVAMLSGAQMTELMREMFTPGLGRIEGPVTVTTASDSLAVNNPKLKASIAADWQQRPLTQPEHKATVAAFVKSLADLIGSDAAQAMVKTGMLSFVTRDNLPPFASHIGNGVQAYEYEGRIYVLADAPIGNASGVLLHESFHAYAKSLLGEDYIPLLQELAKEAGLAAPVVDTNTVMASELANSAPGLTSIEKNLFDRALAQLNAKEVNLIKTELGSAIAEGQKDSQRFAAVVLFKRATQMLKQKATDYKTIEKGVRVQPEWVIAAKALEDAFSASEKKLNDLLEKRKKYRDTYNTVSSKLTFKETVENVEFKKASMAFRYAKDLFVREFQKNISEIQMPSAARTTANMFVGDITFQLDQIESEFTLLTADAIFNKLRDMRVQEIQYLRGEAFVREETAVDGANDGAVVEDFVRALYVYGSLGSLSSERVPRSVNNAAISQVVSELEKNPRAHIVNTYNDIVNRTMQQYIAYTTDDGNVWRKHVKTKKGTADFDIAASSIQTNSHTNWCISGESYSRMYLNDGDIWLLNSKDGNSMLAIRFFNDEIAEIKGVSNQRQLTNYEQRLAAELARTGLVGKKEVLRYANAWGLTELASIVGSQADVDAATKSAKLAADARENGFAIDDDGNVLDVAVAEYRDRDWDGDDVGPEAFDAFWVPDQNNFQVQRERERDEIRANNLVRRELNMRLENRNEARGDVAGERNDDVPFSVRADSPSEAADSDWIAQAKLRVKLAGVSPEHQAEEFAAYAIENYESAPKNIQTIIDKLFAKMKLALATMLRKLKVAPKYRVALLKDPAVLREIALKGLRQAGKRAEGHTNFGAGSILADVAISAQSAVTRVFGKVYGSVQSERIVAGARQFASERMRGYQAPGNDTTIGEKLDVHNLNQFLQEVLTPEQRNAMYQLAHTTFREVFRQLPENYALMLNSKYGFEYTMYNLYHAYINGQLGDQEAIRPFFMLNKAKAKARELLDIYTDDDLALQILKDMSDGTLMNAAKSPYPYMPEMRLKRKQTKAGSVSQKINDAAVKAGDVFERIFYSDYDRARSSGIAAYQEIINRIQYRSGDRPTINPDGTVNRGLLPAIAHQTGKFLQQFDTAVKGLSKEAQERVVRETYFNMPNPRPGKLSEAETEAFYKIRKIYRDAGAYGVAGGTLDAGQIENNPDYTPVIFDIGGDVKTHKVNLRMLLDQGVINEKNGVKKYKYQRTLQAIYELKNPRRHPTDPEPDFSVLDIAAQKAFIDQVVDYAFFDPSSVMLDDQLGKQFKHAHARLFNDIFENYKDGDKADLETLVAMLEPSLGQQAVQYIEPLVIRTEYEKAFPNGLDNKLIEQMRRQGASKAQLAAAARVLDAARNKFTFPILNDKGERGSPTIAMLNKTLATKMHNRETLTAMQNLSAWQNLRLLPLALLSSLVDPQGIAIRSGGDMGASFFALRTGIAGLFDQGLQDQLHAMAEAAGYSAEISAAQALHDGFGAGSRTPWARKVNSFVFKWNGLETWTRQTRYMALVAGHEMLAKWQSQARGENATEQQQANARRYLSELGVKVDDIRVGALSDGPLAGRRQVLLLSPEQRLNATKEQLLADDRVKGALVQFVDEAILRPNILQTPGYFKDPFMSIFTQYKNFSYAIYEQIGRRLALELDHGNYHVVTAALSYLPVILLAELLREFLQWGTEGNPQREQWGVPEYTGLAIAKTGFAGPRIEYASSVKKDAEMGNVPGTSALGPTVGAVGMIKDSATGQRSWGATGESLAPGSALWKNWNNDNAPPAGGGLQRKAVDA